MIMLGSTLPDRSAFRLGVRSAPYSWVAFVLVWQLTLTLMALSSRLMMPAHRGSSSSTSWLLARCVLMAATIASALLKSCVAAGTAAAEENQAGQR